MSTGEPYIRSRVRAASARRMAVASEMLGSSRLAANDSMRHTPSPSWHTKTRSLVRMRRSASVRPSSRETTNSSQATDPSTTVLGRPQEEWMKMESSRMSMGLRE